MKCRWILRKSLSNKKCGTNFTTSSTIEWPVGIQDKRHPEIIDTGEKSTRSDSGMAVMPHIWDTVHTQICRLQLQRAILIFPLMFIFPCSPWVLLQLVLKLRAKSWLKASGQVSSFTSPTIGLWGWKEGGGFFPLVSSFLECSRHSGSQAGLGFPYVYGI